MKIALLALMVLPYSILAQTSVQSTDGVNSLSVQATSLKNLPDYVNARPKALPLAPTYDEGRAAADLKNAAEYRATATTNGQPFVIPRVANGSPGHGKKMPKSIGKPALISTPDIGFAMGTSMRPFTTARADLTQELDRSIPTNETYPYRASGKLFFKEGNSSFICSGSLIGPGLVATAAHCVSDFGKKTYYSDWSFVPGYRDGKAPYGTWSAEKVYILDSYFDGSDACAQSGVVCESDVAVMVLRTQKDANGKAILPGRSTGWYAYPRTDKFGFTDAGLIHVTQIGYPACLDNGSRMQRTDSHGVVSKESSNNTIIGSLMCGGSSGGGWFINFGVVPDLTGANPALASAPNVLVGITSWGSRDDGVKHQGASPIGVKNLVKLVDLACTAYPAACK